MTEADPETVIVSSFPETSSERLLQPVQGKEMAIHASPHAKGRLILLPCTQTLFMVDS